MKPTVRLIDAQERHHITPGTFEVPGPDRLDAIGAGDFVKIGLEFPENEDGMNGERFWVEVLQRNGDDFVGRVDNELYFTSHHGVKLNDCVPFSRQHILATET